MALFSDGTQHGGDWIIMPSVEATSSARPLWQEDPPYANPDTDVYAGVVDPLPGRGGRKTNGYCETEPIEIIYDSPRKFIALCTTTVSDVGGATDLVRLTFTFIFNKVEKNVIILKDVKRLYTKQPMNIQFGNRGEWDLGMAGDTDSYTHWYTDEPVQYWDADDDGTLNATELMGTFDFFKEYMITYKAPKKWWEDLPSEDLPTTIYNEFSEGWYDGIPDSWKETQDTCYGRDWHWDKTIKDHSYAVAQVISQAGDYVGALAVWPHPEFWSAANTFFPPAHTVAPTGENPSNIPLMLAPISRMLEWNKWTVAEDPNQGEIGDLTDRDDIWVKADDIRNPDGSTLEPIIPFVIYEHDFKLSSSLPIYRIVSVYIVTDYHDADDADADDPGNEETWSAGLDVIDREVQYQLDEIFTPWDIYDAMHKNTKRWVQFFDEDWYGDAWNGIDTYQIFLDEYREVESGDLIPSLPVIGCNDWDVYCSFSERVLVDTGTGYELIYPLGYQNIDPIPNPDLDSPYYTLAPTTGLISFFEGDGTPWYLPEGSLVKVLWSSMHSRAEAGVWDSTTELYPFDSDTFMFPLLHDVMPKYKPMTEVFLVGEGVSALLGGDYIYHNKTWLYRGNLYLQDPPGPGEWLWVEYGNDTDSYIEFFLGDGTKNLFTLSFIPNASGISVYATVIHENITESGTTVTPPMTEFTYCVRVPKEDSTYSATGTSTYEAATNIILGGYNETEWLCRDTKLDEEDWIIRERVGEGNEFPPCDELVIDDDIIGAEDELKIVFWVPSGRWEWATVGTAGASVDSVGLAMVTAAFKNKRIEMGIGGLDVQDATFGPRIPWLTKGTSPRYSFYDDWCYSRTGVGLTTSWPISSSNILSVGGTAINNIAVYMNDFAQALVTATPEIYGVTCWDKNTYTGGDVEARYGYAIVSTYKDKNGTVIMLFSGWTGQDSYYACKWFDEHKFELQHINLHVTDLILKIEYEYSDGDLRCPPTVTIVEKLGTISEKPQHDP
jgi:hypothetical protein